MWCRDEDGKQLGQSCPSSNGMPSTAPGLSIGPGTDPRTQKRRQFSRAGFATKKAAQSALAELKTRLDRGTYTEPSKKTLGEYAQLSGSPAVSAATRA